MPSAADFRRAWGFDEGSKLGPNFKIESSHVGHDVKEENERYEFPTTLTVSGGSGSGSSRRVEQRREQLVQTIREHLRPAKRIVYSAYGSPYECTYSAPKVQVLDAKASTFQVTCLGKAKRRRDIPTIAQQKAHERAEKGVPEEVSPEDKQRYLQGYRVIKSRFGSSKCSICGNTIDPGAKIAKDEREEKAGGWVHATCLVQELKEGQEGEEEEEGGSGGEGGVAELAEMEGGKKGGRSAAAAAGKKGGGKAAAATAAAGAANKGTRARSAAASTGKAPAKGGKVAGAKRKAEAKEGVPGRKQAASQKGRQTRRVAREE